MTEQLDKLAWEELFEELEPSPLPDSGSRRQFTSGAVRDMAGKGRCDLLPWDTIGQLITDFTDAPARAFCEYMENVVHAKDAEIIMANLELAFFEFIALAYGGDKFSAFLDVAYHYEQGAKKYSDRNWESGLPIVVFCDSAGRHFLKYLRGDKDEPHARAVVWNMIGAMWTIVHRPEMVKAAYQ